MNRGMLYIETRSNVKAGFLLGGLIPPGEEASIV